MGKQNTINEMQEKVREGLRMAREAIDDETLLKLCDDLEYTWETLCANLIIVGVGLSSMRYRTPEQVGEILRQYLDTINSSKDQRFRMFAPGSNAVN